MADFVFNIGKARAYEAYLDGVDLRIVLLKVAQADATLKDHDTLAAILAAANTEADFTNYARKQVLNANITPNVDDVNERVDIDIPDQTWVAAGGAANNTLAKLIICIDGANDGLRIPLTAHDFVATTDGNDLVAQINAAGFFRAS